MAFAYITHAANDLDVVLRIHEALRQAAIPDAYAGADAPVDDLFNAREALDASTCLIVPVTAHSQRSSRVKACIETAIARGMTILPVRMDKSRLTGFFKREIGPRLDHDGVSEAGFSRFVDAVQTRYRRRCPVLAVMNLKGGVGKTTVSAQVFGALQAETGGRVLLIDFDPQYNLTQHFFTMAEADTFAAEDRSVISLFERSRVHYAQAPSPAESWTRIHTEPFDPAPRRAIAQRLLPAEMPGWLDLVAGQFEISKYAFARHAPDLDTIRSHFLRCIDQFRSAYDLIVFDTNPNATFLTTCALQAADRVIAPMHADEFSLRGVKLLNSLIRSQVRPDDQPSLDILFNSVERNEQSDFEADARTGVFDERVGFALSKSLLQAALPRSNFLKVQGSPEPGDAPYRRLLVHHGRGGGLKQMRDRLKAVVFELQEKLKAPTTEAAREAA